MKRVALALSALLAISASAQTATPPVVFEAENFTGSSMELALASCTTMINCSKTQPMLGPVRSIKVGYSDDAWMGKGGGLKPNQVTIFEYPNFGGLCMTTTQSLTSLAGTVWGNRAVGSYKLNQGGCPPQAVIYENGLFGGRALALTDKVAELGSTGFNDIASSVRLANGATSVALFEHYNFEGDCVTITADSPMLSTVIFGGFWNDRVSSAIVNYRCPSKYTVKVSNAALYTIEYSFEGSTGRLLMGQSASFTVTRSATGTEPERYLRLRSIQADGSGSWFFSKIVTDNVTVTSTGTLLGSNGMAQCDPSSACR
jgi:hypothetical protein